MARELKPISFNPDNKSDKELLSYIDNIGISFGAYVKLLIRKDMMSSKESDTNEIATQLKELVSVLKNNTFLVEKNDNIASNIIEETEEERKQRIAMENFMNMGGK